MCLMEIMNRLQDLKLDTLVITEEYKKHSWYYNSMQTAFYTKQLTMQCDIFKLDSGWIDNAHMWESFYTDKYVVSATGKTPASIGKNVVGTYYVEDVYYNISKLVYEACHTLEETEVVINFLVNNNKSKRKPFIMQYLIGAIEAVDKIQFELCAKELRSFDFQSKGDWK